MTTLTFDSIFGNAQTLNRKNAFDNKGQNLYTYTYIGKQPTLLLGKITGINDPDDKTKTPRDTGNKKVKFGSSYFVEKLPNGDLTVSINGTSYTSGNVGAFTKALRGGAKSRRRRRKSRRVRKTKYRRRL
jgi:hypothetical protein